MTRMASPWARMRGGGNGRERAGEGGSGGSSKPGPTWTATTRSAGILLAGSRPRTPRRAPPAGLRPPGGQGGEERGDGQGGGSAAGQRRAEGPPLPHKV